MSNSADGDACPPPPAAQAVLDVGAIVMGPEIAGRLPAAEYTRNQLYALTHEVFVAFD